MMRSYLITGGGSGIGAALARSLATDGALVFICGRDEAKLAEVASSAPAIQYRPCDVASAREVDALSTWIRAQTQSLNGVVNAAGLFGPIGRFDATDAERWLYTLQVHVGGTYLVSRATLTLLMKGESPRIVNFAGGGAFNPFPGYSAYAVSKAAVVRLTENMAAELDGTPVRVNAIAPGMVSTPIHEETLRSAARVSAEHLAQTRRALETADARPMETAIQCARFLLSPAVSITGRTLSARFDPWDEPGFSSLLPQIQESDLYRMQRINPVHLPDGNLKNQLLQMLARKHQGQ